MFTHFSGWPLVENESEWSFTWFNHVDETSLIPYFSGQRPAKCYFIFDLIFFGCLFKQNGPPKPVKPTRLQTLNFGEKWMMDVLNKTPCKLGRKWRSFQMVQAWDDLRFATWQVPHGWKIFFFFEWIGLNWYSRIAIYHPRMVYLLTSMLDVLWFPWRYIYKIHEWHGFFS